MKTTKNFITLLTVIILTVRVNAQAQQRTPEERAQMETSMVKEQVVLADSQVVKYEAIALKYAKLRQDIRNSSNGDMEMMRQKMTELNEKKKAEVKPFLTSEQFVKYEKWMEENRNRRMGGGGNPGNGNPQ